MLDPSNRNQRSHGPVLPTLLRLALPTVLVLFVQTLVSVAETYFVSFLDPDMGFGGQPLKQSTISRQNAH